MNPQQESPEGLGTEEKAVLLGVLVVLSTMLAMWYRKRHAIRASVETLQISSVAAVEDDDRPEELSVPRRVTKPLVSVYINNLFDEKRSVVEMAKSECIITPEAHEALANLIDLCKISKMVFISRVQTDEDENAVRTWINQVFPRSLWEDKLLEEHRLLFTSSDQGRISVVRQLQPSVHIDNVAEVILALKGKVANLVDLNEHEQKDASIATHTPRLSLNMLKECTSVLLALSSASPDPA